MRKTLFFIAILASFVSTYAQPRTPDEFARNQMEIRRQSEQRQIGSGSQNKDIAQNITIKPELRLSASIRDKFLLSKQEKDELKTLLSDNKIKIFKVWNNICEAFVVDVNKEECVKKNDYRAASVFSLYLKTYLNKTAHFNLINGEIIVPTLEKSIQLIASIGDIPLSEINKKSSQVLKIKSFKTKEKDYQKVSKQIENGIEIDGLSVSNKSSLKKNQTFLIRSIFQDNFTIPSFTLDYDKVYVVRILNDDDGIITIAWKEM
jgi:hypothetical protein